MSGSQAPTHHPGDLPDPPAMGAAACDQRDPGREMLPRSPVHALQQRLQQVEGAPDDAEGDGEAEPQRQMLPVWLRLVIVVAVSALLWRAIWEGLLVLRRLW
ncbi:hypothetical protein SAMN05660666_01770 [Novosphingobium aromaticivorans]|nr:hypothetical protein SAMN05660666_01770 [Novosphingobium aromaticivorans]